MMLASARAPWGRASALLALSCTLTALPGHAASPPAHRVLALVDSGASGPVHGRTFASALALQLTPYDLQLSVASWRPPMDAASRLRDAARRVRRARAIAAVWFTVEPGPGGQRQVIVHVLRRAPAAGQPGAWEIPMGAVASGMERDMALAVRTWLQARASTWQRGAVSPTATRPTTRPAASRPATRPTSERVARPPKVVTPRPTPQTPLPAVRLWLGLAYALEAPSAGGIYHGPELVLSAQPRPWLELRVLVGFRFGRSGEASNPPATWTEHLLRFGALAGFRRPLGERLATWVGARLVGAAVFVDAESGSRDEHVTLYELSVGPVAGLSYRLGRWFSLGFTAHLGYLAVSHRLSIEEREVLRGGRIEFGGSLLASVVLW